MKRRHILGGIALGTGALVVGWSILPPRQRLMPSEPLPAVPQQTALNGWVRIGEDDKVTIIMSKAEMGQGVFTGLAMMLADELDARWDQIGFEQAPIDDIYNNQSVVADGLPFHPDNHGAIKRFAQWMTHKTMREFGLMATGGSSSMKDLWLPMREAGASARAMLLGAAAHKWQLPAGECTVKDGVIAHPSGVSAKFGELAALAAQRPRPSSVSLKTPDQFKLIGHATQRLEGSAKTDGSALYTADFKPEGLLYACVRMNPELGAPMTSFDAAQAESLPGVRKVLAVPADKGSTAGVAVVAQSTYQAMKALRQIRVDWGHGPAQAFSSSEVQATLLQGLASDASHTYFEQGDADKALQSAAKTVQAQYSAPYLAHATMEPISCTVWLKKGEAELWAPSQVPDAARHVVADILGVPKDKVTMHLPLLGSGFGRRLELDFVAQAAHIAKAMPGQPVQTLWDRSQELQHDFYRPACVSQYTAGLDAQGQLVAWTHRSASQSIAADMISRLLGVPGGGPDKTTAEGAFDQAYEWPHARISHSTVKLPIPVGSWRSVGHSHQAFFKESFVDEVAHASGQDPLAFRLSLLKNHPRHAKVLQLAADQSGWGKPLPAGPDGVQRALGLALHESFGTIVAQVAEVSVVNREIRVHRVVCAADCGTVVNPDGVAQQMESAVVYGLSAALWGEITLDKGQVQQSNFHDHPILRINQAPQVHTHMVASDAHPEGMGEPGTPPIAPAVANAVFALTGQRLRSLPLRLT